MSGAVPSLGEFEVQVLRLVWQEQPCTERQITELVQKDRPVARTTVLKTMHAPRGQGAARASESRAWVDPLSSGS